MKIFGITLHRLATTIGTACVRGIVRRAYGCGKLVVSILDDPFYVTTTHQLGDHVWLGFVVPGDDVRMGTKADHGLGFAGDAGAGDFVQALSFSSRVLGQVDPLLADLSTV